VNILILITMAIIFLAFLSLGCFIVGRTLAHIYHSIEKKNEFDKEKL